jgi:hypothetical protein
VRERTISTACKKTQKKRKGQRAIAKASEWRLLWPTPPEAEYFSALHTFCCGAHRRERKTQNYSKKTGNVQSAVEATGKPQGKTQGLRRNSTLRIRRVAEPATKKEAAMLPRRPEV